MDNERIIFEKEYMVSKAQYIEGRMAYEKKFGRLRNSTLWLILSIIIMALPFSLINWLLTMSYGIIIIAVIFLCGLGIFIFNLFFRPSFYKELIQKDYDNSILFSSKQNIILKRDTYVYQNCCEKLFGYYSECPCAIETKSQIVIGSDIAGKIIIMPKNEISPEIISFLKENFGVRYIK